MFWSVIYTAAFIIVVIGLTFGAAWLTDLSGGAVISVGGIEFTLSPIQMALGFIALVLAVIVAIQVLGLLGAVLRFVNGDETVEVSIIESVNRQMKKLRGAE